MGLSVVILSRDAGNLVPCVQAVQALDPECRIIVVDDGAWEGAQKHLHGVWVVPGEKPFCFARNANIGILEAGDDDVILLNDDALLRTPGGFTAMQRAATEYPECGLIASTCNNVGNPNQLPVEPYWGESAACRYPAVRFEPRMVCFVCVLIPRQTIETVGLLDQSLVAYGLDDDDLSLRVRNAGLKLGVFDGCYVDHGSLQSSYRRNPENTIRPNLTRFIQKWGVDNWGRTKETSDFPDCFPS